MCIRDSLTANFPSTIDTQGLAITDFLPISNTFDSSFNKAEGQQALKGDTLPGTTFNHSEASSSETGGAIKWTLPERCV